MSHVWSHSSDNIKELQEALQNKTAELSAERNKVADITRECDNLQSQLAEFLGEKQKKLQGNLFEVKVRLQRFLRISESSALHARKITWFYVLIREKLSRWISTLSCIIIFVGDRNVWWGDREDKSWKRNVDQQNKWPHDCQRPGQVIWRTFNMYFPNNTTQYSHATEVKVDILCS